MSACKPASQNEAWSLKRVSGKSRPLKGRKSDSTAKSVFLRKPLQTACPKRHDRQFAIMPMKFPSAG
jgi:hypothetical protein